MPANKKAASKPKKLPDKEARKVIEEYILKVCQNGEWVSATRNVLTVTAAKPARECYSTTGESPWKVLEDTMPEDLGGSGRRRGRRAEGERKAEDLLPSPRGTRVRHLRGTGGDG